MREGRITGTHRFLTLRDFCSSGLRALRELCGSIPFYYEGHEAHEGRVGLEKGLRLPPPSAGSRDAAVSRGRNFVIQIEKGMRCRPPVRAPGMRPLSGAKLCHTDGVRVGFNGNVGNGVGSAANVNREWLDAGWDRRVA